MSLKARLYRGLLFLTLPLLLLLIASPLIWPDVDQIIMRYRAADIPAEQAMTEGAFPLPANHGLSYLTWRQTQPQAIDNLFAPGSEALLHAIQNSLYQIPAYRGQLLNVVGDLRFGPQTVEIQLETIDNPHVRDRYRWQADSGWVYEQAERLFSQASHERRVPLHTLTFALLPSLYADARQRSDGLYQARIPQVVFATGTKRTVQRLAATTHVGLGNASSWVVRLHDSRSMRTVIYAPHGRLRKVVD